jgi:phosphotransferase system enzyme I (PtsI)
MTVIKGLGVSAGIGIGTAIVLHRSTGDFGFGIPPGRIPREVERLQKARAAARQQITHIKERIASSAGAEHAYLFDAQLLMLDDRMLVDRAIEIIRTRAVNAETALQRTLDEISALFDRADDPYLRERRGDVSDVVGRLLGNLRVGADPLDAFRELEGPLVLVADELTPSIVAQLDWQRLAALVSEEGSWTDHTAILARSIRIPAVAGLRRASATIPPGALVAVDGSTGEVIVDPDESTLQRIRLKGRERALLEESLDEFRSLPGITADGLAIRLEANIESPGDADRARERGAEGIGLFRSEFLLATAGLAALDEHVQYEAYRELLTRMAPSPVTIRTFDISDTQLHLEHAGIDGSREPLGLRGIRLSLARDDIFQPQLKALLRAAAHGSLRIMFPFVSGVEELRAAREALARAAADLRAGGCDVPRVATGVMIEVPSAALTADLLAAEADFFAVGTNDLIQYTLAVDRTDDTVSRLYEPLHPAILRTLRAVSRAARRRNIRVSVCGEMAADPVLLTLLVGLGLTEFSMSPGAIPLAKQVLRDLNAAEARRAAGRALRASTAADVERELIEFIAPRTGVRGR